MSLEFCFLNSRPRNTPVANKTANICIKSLNAPIGESVSPFFPSKRTLGTEQKLYSDFPFQLQSPSSIKSYGSFEAQGFAFDGENRESSEWIC